MPMLPPVIVEVIAEDGKFLATIAKDKAVLAAWAKETTNTNLGANTAPALAEVQTFRTIVDREPIEIPVEVTGGGAAGLGGLLGLLGRLGGGGGGGVLGDLGWGRGILGMAKFGSALSLLGLGFEHVFTMAIGLVGSFTGALMGGALLALGAVGTAAVGMGTDMAGIGQAAGDIKNVYSAMQNVTTAVNAYGKGSYQAVQAQQQLNGVLKSFSPIARAAVTAAATTAVQFHAMFNRLTGPAERLGAIILNQLMKVGEGFLPTIGKFAAENMNIIRKDIQPLFAWLGNKGKGGGLGIFTDLEKIFQGQLPTAIHAMTQGIELFAKTVDVAAHYTGGFVKTLDKFLTRANSPSGMASWSREIGKLIGLFHTWLDLAGSMVSVIIAVFKPAVGFGAAFANELRRILTDTKNWLDLSSTQSALKGLFSAHLLEIVKGLGGAIVAALPAIEGFAAGFIEIATVGARLVAGVFVPIIKFLEKLGPALPIIGMLVAGVIGVNAALNLWSATMKGISAVMAMGPWVLALIALVAIATLVYEHWHGVLTGLKDIWHAIETAAKVVWGALKSFFHSTIGQIILAVTMPVVGLVNFLVQHWNTIHRDAVAAWNAVIAFLRGVGKGIIGAFAGAGTWLVDIGKQIIGGLVKGLISAWGGVKGIITRFGHDLIGWAKDIWHIFSPSQDFATIGAYLTQGIGVGMLSKVSELRGTLASVDSQLITDLHNFGPKYFKEGAYAGEQYALGLKSQQATLTATLRANMQAAMEQAFTAAVTDVSKQANAMALKAARAGAGKLY